MKKNILKSLKIVLLGIIFYIIGNNFYLNWDKIVSHEWRLDPFYFAMSFIILVVLYLFSYLIWYTTQRAISIRLPFFEGSRIWALSNLGKYLPGHIWLILGRISYLTASGVSKKRAIFSSYMENILIFPSATIAILIMELFSKNKIEWFSYPMIILLISGCLLFSHPKILELTINFIFKRLKKDKVQVQYRFSMILIVILMHTIYWFIHSYAFFLLINSVYVTDFSTFFDIAFAFTASWMIGFLTIFAPAGLGVREELMIIFLNKTLPKFTTPVIAVVARVWIVASEIVSLALILLLHKMFLKDHDRDSEQKEK